MFTKCISWLHENWGGGGEGAQWLVKKTSPVAIHPIIHKVAHWYITVHKHDKHSNVYWGIKTLECNIQAEYYMYYMLTMAVITW